MLPILRIIPVGGVFLAIVILALALGPPGGSHSQFTSITAPARGALLERSSHPEWRQFLILAATRRADELNRLRDLPDTPVRTDKAPEVANLPADRSGADADDATGSIAAPAGSTLPMEIGEPSSTELPVTKQDEKPPVITPARLKTHNESRKTGIRRARRVKPPSKPGPTQFNLFSPLFGGSNIDQAATAGTINP